MTETPTREAAGAARLARLLGALRVVATLLLALVAGAFSGAYLFGDSLAHHSFPRLAAELAIGHALGGLLLGTCGGRWWPLALLGAWGACVVSALYAQSGVWNFAALSAAMALVLCAGAWWGGRLIRPAPARLD